MALGWSANARRRVLQPIPLAKLERRLTRCNSVNQGSASFLHAALEHFAATDGRSSRARPKLRRIQADLGREIVIAPIGNTNSTVNLPYGLGKHMGQATRKKDQRPPGLT